MRALKCLLALAPATALYWCLRLAWADSQSPHERPAAALSIKRGLHNETRGDFAAAERDLLRAAELDNRYDPRWTLANYYFRRGDTEKFWRWARAASEMAYGDMRALFRLCRRVSRDPPPISERPEVLRQYAAFLLAEDGPEAALKVADRIAPRAVPQDAPVLLDVCDRLLEARNGEGALRLWKALPARAPGRGFDWRVPAIEGVSASRALRVSFSGKQPERCEPLWKYEPVAPGRAYRVQFAYRTESIPPASGLRLRVLNAGAVLGESGELSGEAWTGARFDFTAPPRASVIRLALCYQRALGTVRIEGSAWLRDVNLGFRL